MKKLVYVSDESIVAGNAKCGISDVVDGLSNACSDLYHVCVVTQDHQGYLTQVAPSENYMEGVREVKLLGSWYYLIQPSRWEELLPVVVQSLNPDILHNFAAPELLGMLDTAPKLSVYTIDQAKYVQDKEDSLNLYNVITTVSEAYAEELLSAGDSLASFLANKDFRGITNGIIDNVLDPSTGLLIDYEFSNINIQGKSLCKKSLLNSLNVTGDPVIFSSIARISPEKGIESLLSVAETIKDSGGILIVYGRGDEEYEKEILKMQEEGNLYYIQLAPSLTGAIPVLAGSDFHISPSVTEPCGLMPMVASRYGAIPITTLAGGLSNNFSESNAIVIEDSISDAINTAFSLVKTKSKRDFFTAKVMSQNFSWRTRKVGYISIYNMDI